MRNRQGPACDLWCKHRNERGIPITRFVGNTQDHRGKSSSQQTTQLNAVIVTNDQYLADSDLVDHVACDYSECITQGIADADEDASAMVVTRAAKMKQGPIKWADQEEVRTKVQRRLDKQDPMVQEIITMSTFRMPMKEIKSLGNMLLIILKRIHCFRS